MVGESIAEDLNNELDVSSMREPRYEVQDKKKKKIKH